MDKRYDDVSEVVCDAMRQKIAAGVEIPAYPQFQDMNQQFLGIINDPASAEAPFLVKEDCAGIIELQLLEPVAKEYFEENGGVEGQGPHHRCDRGSEYAWWKT